MSDHKFEQQVRQKLGDLKLTPTAQSWERIEKELRENKRRRVPLFWIPLLMIGLGVGGYFVLQPVVNKVEEKVIAGKEIHKEKEVTSRGREWSSGVGSETSSETAARPGDDNEQVVGGNPPSAAQQSVSFSESLNATRYRSQPSLRSVAPEAGSNSRPINNINSLELQPSDLKSEPESNENSEEINTQSNQREQDNIEPDNIIPQNQKEESITPGTDSTSPSTQPEQKKRKIKKWSFGVGASAGVSAINEGKFVNFGNPQVEDVALSPGFNTPPPQPTAAAPATPKPSKIYPGFSYSAGIIAKYELSKRFSLSAGLNYLQLNTRTEVGYGIDASRIANSSNNLNSQQDGLLYLPGSGSRITEYRNRYHFIEVPVQAHLLINRSPRLPLYWNAGISASKLLSSNSLHYDSYADVYYKNDDLLTDFQAAFTTGFSVSLFNKTSRPLWIGPSVRYNITPVLKKDISARKNFMGLGVDLRWYLK